MSLATAMANDLAKIMDSSDPNSFAQSISYNGTTIDAIVTYEENDFKKLIATIEIQSADVALPDYRDTIIIGSLTYKVKKRLSGDAYYWKIQAEASERVMVK